MTAAVLRRHFFCAIILLNSVGALALTDQSAATQPAANLTAHLKWLDSLDATYLQAQRDAKPILVVVVDGSRPAGPQVIGAVESAVSRDPKQTWEFVRLDVRQSEDAARDLGIAMSPAICALSADGRVVGTKRDRLDDATLPQWIESMRLAATSKQMADSPSRKDSIAQLASQDEATRESAVRRLEGDRDAASDVVEVLFDGPMSARLAALDLLEQWGAPMQGIDPWNPSTMTASRRKLLEAWSRSGAPASRPSSSESSASIAGVDIELDAILNAPTDLEARAIREQMVHFGAAALPLVRHRMENESSDQGKQRLLALRYRLAATDRLAQQWPGGFDRLASLDPFVRRSAIDELSQHITADDSELLVELFSDNDEFVRERSLRMLKSVGGAKSTRALIHLLDDPEPNVRAAVLKTLGENPDPSLAPDLARYAQSERDADLIVHCIGVLQAIPGNDADNSLKALLHHPAWRVRAAACEAIHQKMQAREQIDPDEAAALVVELCKRLDDPDNFVISQAAIALVSFNVSPGNLAVVSAMGRHSTLALDVLNSLPPYSESATMLLPAIRNLISNPRPQVRAAAIRAICRFAPTTAGAEVAAGLNDSDAMVRQEAATGLASVIEEIFPQDGYLYVVPGNNQSSRETVDVGQWVRDFTAGTRAPSWIMPLRPQLGKMISDPDEQTRVAAAMSLCALGGESQAWPVLWKSANSELARGTEAAALPWLGWDKRKLLWDRLVAITPDGQLARLIQQFVAVPDDRVIPPLWSLLRDPPRDLIWPEVHDALQKIYGVNQYSMTVNGQLQPPSTAKPQKCLADAAAMLRNGGELQKVEALCLTAEVAPDDVVKPAGEIYRDKKNSASLRIDALQILLIMRVREKSEPLAIEAISDPALRKIAVSYLAMGAQAIDSIRQRVYLDLPSTVLDPQTIFGGSGTIIPVPVPAGLNAASLREMLSDNDQDIAGYAGYLLTILGDRRGLDPLLRAAAAHGFQDDNWRKLSFRALAKLDDDSQTPTLQRIYESYGTQTWQVREFYWTIRAMHGPNILKLRKKIRDEVGMNQLQ